MSSTIEHIVLFKIKDETENSQLSLMLHGLNNLNCLDTVLHLSAGPVHRIRSTSRNFTHLLHARYRSKEDLAAYSAHPDHMAVVRSTLPINEDIMAVDWVADNIAGPESPKPGSAIRVQFVKVKQGLGEREKGEVMEAIKEKVNGTVGENFSAARAKGFSIGSVAVFSGIEELEAVDLNVEEDDKVRDYIDELLIVDYVFPSV